MFVSFTTTQPAPAALAAAARFLEIEAAHGANGKRTWAMFAAALKKHGVTEWDVQEALEFLEDEALELHA